MWIVLCRNWHWNKPSCDGEKCVVLYDWPSALPDEGAGFKWNNDDCNSKNSVVCKYPEGESASGTVHWAM